MAKYEVFYQVFLIKSPCGIFTLPVTYAIQAYKQAFHEFPLENRSLFSSEIIRKADPRYAEVLSKLRGGHIKTAMQTFLDKSGIRKDLIFIETPNLGFCNTLGTNIFRKSDATVIVAPGFYEADKDACSWVMKHEISHIKNNDTFTMPCVPCICQLAASIFGMCSLSFLPALGLAFTVGIVSRALFSQWREAKADDFAIENSSDEELKGGRRFLIAVKEASIEERNTFWKRVIISARGNNRLDILHPSITSRIHKIESALRARNVEIDIKTEKHRIDNVKKFMADKMREIMREIEKLVGLSVY